MAKTKTPTLARKSAVIVLLPTVESARRLALPNGDPATELHCTLHFLAEADREAVGRSELAVGCRKAAEVASSLTEHVEAVSGLGSDDPQAQVLLLTNRHVGTVRNLLTTFVPTIPPSRFPNFTPHVTLGYGIEIDPKPFVGLPILFDRIGFWWGDDRIEYPLR